MHETLEETGYSMVVDEPEALTLDHLTVWAARVYDCRTHVFRGHLIDAMRPPAPVCDAAYNLGCEWVPRDQVAECFDKSTSNSAAIRRLLAMY